ncbi:LysE family transporter [Salmonella enterica subsp. enterica]|nr:LysE family transporter [Salmonella enterica subsp. enterica]
MHCGVMVWAGVALLGLHLIISEKMARLHTIIMAAACACVLDGLSDAARRAEKQDAAASSPHDELAQAGAVFSKGLLTNLSNLKRLSILVPFFTVCRR